ncbi:unnamed protein product [Eruca vesicaria subsp. sativa]|uniref:Uncharacterized protein n=1 Tax=Eruca vesicaria subsp. sativa TaxID=29727 RepID=A0ABC8KIS0_ERUVS|nr:unnamed protein product [Eruca vesicaria subsp. sativa]
MSDRYKPPRKQLPKRSLLSEPSGDSSTDDESNKGERKSPYKALLIRARSYATRDNEENKVAREVPLQGPFMRPSQTCSDSASLDSEYSTSSEELEVTSNNSSDEETENDPVSEYSTSSEELEVTKSKNNDAENEPPNKKRRLHRKSFTPRRIIPPEAEVNQTDAKSSSSGGSKKASSD